MLFTGSLSGDLPNKKCQSVSQHMVHHNQPLANKSTMEHLRVPYFEQKRLFAADDWQLQWIMHFS